MKFKSPVWKIEDIQSLPEFGGKIGWFYGLVRDIETNKVMLAEVFPGLGYTSAFPLWDKYDLWTLGHLPKTIRWIIKDIIWAVKCGTSK